MPAMIEWIILAIVGTQFALSCAFYMLVAGLLKAVFVR